MEVSQSNISNLKKVHNKVTQYQVYLFILCLEKLFTIVKNNEDMKNLKIFRNTSLYTAYADDTTFFKKNKLGSIKELLNTIFIFSLLSGLKPNLSKCEIAQIGLLKRVKMAACGIKCTDLTKDAIKVLGLFFSYNENIELEQNFKKTIIGTEKVFRMCRRSNFTLEGKIIIFKTLALSKFVFLAQVLPIPNEINTTIQRIQREFIWNSSNAKIKHETICNKFQDGGLRNVDIPSKISNLQCSWIKKLYDQNSHDWKLIPTDLINNEFGKNFIFHSNLSFKTSVLHQFPTF